MHRVSRPATWRRLQFIVHYLSSPRFTPPDVDWLWAVPPMFGQERVLRDCLPLSGRLT